jgi:hypothetical protein
MLPDRALGVLGGALVIGALVMLFVGGEPDGGGSGEIVAPPVVEIVAPADGAVLSGPLEVVFRVPARLSMRPGGWGVGDFHLHLSLDGVELMPATADLEPVGEGEYRWRVGRLEPGTHPLHLLWSGRDHRPLPETRTATVRVTVSPPTAEAGARAGYPGTRPDPRSAPDA